MPEYHPDDRIPVIAPLAGDDRLRSGGFTIARHERDGTRFWRARGSVHLFLPEEAGACIDRLIAAQFSRDGDGGWLFEGDVYTTIQALDFVDRLQ